MEVMRLGQEVVERAADELSNLGTRPVVADHSRKNLAAGAAAGQIPRLHIGRGERRYDQAMTVLDTHPDIAAVLADRRLLHHPFYRRWEKGEVSIEELAAYAAQYRHFEAYLPGFLEALVGGLPAGTAKDLVAANLADEMGDPIPHIELFERFAAATGAEPEVPSLATSDLLATYRELLGESPVAALAGFVAYESQASDVARTKAEGLRRHHGFDDHAASFWQHHADVDARHAEWAWSALDDLADAPAQITAAVQRAADAWWGFLDEREAVAQSG
jgi:pyrroloquinoline-quinone synthase